MSELRKLGWKQIYNIREIDTVYRDLRQAYGYDIETVGITFETGEGYLLWFLYSV